MKKQLLVVAAFIVATFSANAQVLPYSSGNISLNQDFTLPDFWTGNCTTMLKNGLDTTKDGYAEFAAGIGIAVDATEAFTIRMAKTEGEGYSELTLPSCGTITLVCWGTGGRGMAIRKDSKDGELLGWNGGGGYRAISVEATVNSTEPIKIFLVPTGATEGSASTGDTFISEITITSGPTTGINDLDLDKKVVAVEYYSVTGLKFEEAQQGLNIVKTTYEDGSVKTTKAFIK